MKSWRFHEFGNINSLRMEDVTLPVPSRGECLIKLEYAALNPADRFLVEGNYPRPGTPPFAVGRDGCGVIVETRGGLFSPGDRVVILRSDIGVTRDGTLAEYVTVPESCLAPLPAGWTPQEGAAGPLVLLTAWQALVTEGGLQPGQTVLVTGASGGVGTAAVMLAKSLGARVAALSRSEEKRQRLTLLGADFAFDSSDPDIVKTVRDTLGGPVDVVVENLAGPFLQKSIQMTGIKGRISVVGMLAGNSSEFTVGSILFKRIRITGIAVGNFTNDEAQEAWREIVTVLNTAHRRPVIDKVFPFEEVHEAFDHLAKSPMGKVLVSIN